MEKENIKKEEIATTEDAKRTAETAKEETANAETAKILQKPQKEETAAVETAKKEEKPNIKKFRTIAPIRPRRPERIEEKKEFEEKVLEIKRVARVVRGGRRFKFRAAVVVGNRAGKIGIGVGKGSEVTGAVSKAVARAKKNMVEIKMTNMTIPFDIKSTFKGALVLLKPARKGTGIIAGGAVRAVVESAGISDISSKMLGSASKISNMVATFEALKKLSKAGR